MCQAPDPAQGWVSDPTTIAEPYTAVYITIKDSQDVCQLALRSFAASNVSVCRDLRRSIGEMREYRDEPQDAVVAYGGRLCNDSELPDNQDYTTCHGTTFCRISSNYAQCPMSVLQQYLDPIRFRFQCVKSGQEAFTIGEQPDTLVKCMTAAEKKKYDEDLVMAEETRNQKVYLAEGTLFMAKATPWVPKFTCVDLELTGASSSKGEL